jgi:hypothetical protein
VYEQERDQEQAASCPLHGGRHYRPVPARRIRCHEGHASEDEEQDRDEDQLVRERLILLHGRLQALFQQAGIDAHHMRSKHD